MIDSTKVVERNVAEMLLNKLVVIRGIAKTGKNIGKEYSILAVDKASQYDPLLADLAEQINVQVVDIRGKA